MPADCLVTVLMPVDEHRDDFLRSSVNSLQQQTEPTWRAHRDHRAHFRLTTHLPRTVNRRELARIYRKHGLPRRLAKQRIRAATKSHLRQCLYRSTLEQRVREALRREPKRLWRERYR